MVNKLGLSQNGCSHFLQAISIINHERQTSPLKPWQVMRRRAGAQQLTPSSLCYSIIFSVSKKADVTFTFYFAYEEKSQRTTETSWTSKTCFTLGLEHYSHIYSHSVSVARNCVPLSLLISHKRLHYGEVWEDGNSFFLPPRVYFHFLIHSVWLKSIW